MHGVGNDYIFFDCFSAEVSDPGSVALRFSDRHFGIGADGVILILPSSVADGEMRIYNADGSEGKMCGNGIRCVGKFLFDTGKTGGRTNISINTRSGIKHLRLFTDESGRAVSACVDMGRAEFFPSLIPAFLSGNKIIGRKITAGTAEYRITCLSVGNPHCVIFGRTEGVDFGKINSDFFKSGIFPEGVNIEIAEKVDDGKIKMRVWERGSGETLACGTGACAVAVAAVENGFFKKGDDIAVELPGGTLKVNYTDSAVLLTGGCEYVYKGEIDI